MIRVVLADDHKIILDGVRALITRENSIEVIGEASNGAELLEVLSQALADVVVLDINMPVMDGFEAAKRIKEIYPSVRILVLSMLDHEKYILRMMEAGALGYILKNTGKDEFIHAVHTVAKGKPYICTAIALDLLQKIHQMDVKPLKTISTNGIDISKREMEVLRLIAEGYTNAEIADKLFTSKRTIESHRQNLLEKTQCSNTAMLIKYALTHGIIE